MKVLGETDFLQKCLSTAKIWLAADAANPHPVRVLQHSNISSFLQLLLASSLWINKWIKFKFLFYCAIVSGEDNLSKCDFLSTHFRFYFSPSMYQQWFILYLSMSLPVCFVLSYFTTFSHRLLFLHPWGHKYSFVAFFPSFSSFSLPALDTIPLKTVLPACVQWNEMFMVVFDGSLRLSI